MPPALSNICIGLPPADNYFFWISLFMGIGAGCASILAALAYFVAIMRDKASRGEVSKIIFAFTCTAMLTVTVFGFFSVAVLVRAVKVSVPGVQGAGLLAFGAGLLVTLAAHILLCRDRVKF